MSKPKLIDEPQHWRAYAKEARVRADQMREDVTRLLLSIGATYARVAELTAAQLRDRQS
jgi:hypothetical protein